MGLHGLTIEFKTLTSVNFNATCQVPFDCCQGWHDGVPFTAIAFPLAEGPRDSQEIREKGARPRHSVVWCGHHWVSTWSTFFRDPFNFTGTFVDLQPRGRGQTGCYRCEGPHSSHNYIYIWVDENISLTWIVRIFGDDFPIKTHGFPGFGRNLPSKGYVQFLDSALPLSLSKTLLDRSSAVAGISATLQKINSSTLAVIGLGRWVSTRNWLFSGSNW